MWLHEVAERSRGERRPDLDLLGLPSALLPRDPSQAIVRPAPPAPPPPAPLPSPAEAREALKAAAVAVGNAVAEHARLSRRLSWPARGGRRQSSAEVAEQR